MKTKTKNQARLVRHYRIRNKISGTSKIPRLSIFRSNKYLYFQLIDDVSKKTLVAGSTKNLKSKKFDVDLCLQFGESSAKKIKAKKITKIVFDRGGYLYHGKIKAFADGLRKGGVKF